VQSVVTSGVLGFAFPAHVVLIQGEVFENNPQHEPVPKIVKVIESLVPKGCLNSRRCVPILIPAKIERTPTGMVGQASRFAGNRWKRSGSAS
jgi:hypothetical protein